MRLTIPENAPFHAGQRAWLKGFLDGISSTIAPRTTATEAPASPTTTPGLQVTIAFGSQTGTSESIAKKLAKHLGSKGHQPIIKDMAQIRASELANTSHLLVITSTYGDGEPPDNAAALHGELHADDAPTLSSLRFSVLALGDSSYPMFCKCGHDFDQRLSSLGANRIAPIVECDVDHDAPFSSWLAQIEQALSTH